MRVIPGWCCRETGCGTHEAHSHTPATRLPHSISLEARDSWRWHLCGCSVICPAIHQAHCYHAAITAWQQPLEPQAHRACCCTRHCCLPVRGPAPGFERGEPALLAAAPRLPSSSSTSCGCLSVLVAGCGLRFPASVLQLPSPHSLCLSSRADIDLQMCTGVQPGLLGTSSLGLMLLPCIAAHRCTDVIECNRPQKCMVSGV